MTEKDCGNHHHDDDDEESSSSCCRQLLTALLSLIVITLVGILIAWAVLRPTKPRFILQDATLYAFNSTRQPNLLTTTVQVTLTTVNPNHRVGVYYTRLHVSASYRNQQITLPTLLPPTYQGHKDTVIWSPFLYGSSVPVADYVAASLAVDVEEGLVPVVIKVDGQVKWKVGTWISHNYHLWVSCPAYIGFGSRSNGVLVGSGIKYQISTRCDVSV